jgi:hypothetical protein
MLKRLSKQAPLIAQAKGWNVFVFEEREEESMLRWMQVLEQNSFTEGPYSCSFIESGSIITALFFHSDSSEDSLEDACLKALRGGSDDL